MGMVVRTNTMALNAYRQLGLNNSAVSKSLEKLASGFRINRAGDDAAGFAISEKMQAQITGLETAATNAQNGISLIQTAEGNLSEVHDMLNRMVELATKSANGIYTSTEREALQAEVDQLLDEIDRISQSANFNGAKLLDGTMGMNTNAITNLMGKGAVAASSGKLQDANLISDVHYEAVGNSPTGPTFTVDFGALRVNGERDEEVEISIQVGESTYGNGCKNQHNGPISKRGNGNARYVLFNTVMSLLMVTKRNAPDDPVRLYYEKKRGEGKHHHACATACCTKLLCIMFAMGR